MFGKKRKMNSPEKSDIDISDHQYNPYLAARKEWDERYGELITRETNWRRMALLCAMIAVLAVAGLFYIGAQSKIQPYIVQVDGFGRQVGGGFVQGQPGITDAVRKATLTKFVTDLRSVVSDGIVQRQMIERVYAHISNGSPAQAQISDYYRADPPQQRAQTQIVTTDIVAAFAPSPSTYEVEWIETTRNTSGKVVDETRWRGNFQLVESKPSDMALVSLNPLGIYVTNVAWSKVNR